MKPKFRREAVKEDTRLYKGIMAPFDRLPKPLRLATSLTHGDPNIAWRYMDKFESRPELAAAMMLERYQNIILIAKKGDLTKQRIAALRKAAGLKDLE